MFVVSRQMGVNVQWMDEKESTNSEIFEYNHVSQNSILCLAELGVSPARIFKDKG